jgi:hypothetical protein
VCVCVCGQSLVIRTFSQSQDLYEALTHIGSKALIWKVDCKANVRSAAFQKVPFWFVFFRKVYFWIISLSKTNQSCVFECFLMLRDSMGS